MSLHAIRPAVANLPRPAVPLVGPPAPGIAALVVAGILVVGSGVIALVADEAGFRLVMGSLAALLAVAAVAIGVYAFSVTPGLIRVDTGSASLRFAAPARVRGLFTALGVAALLPGAVAVLTGVVDETPLRGGGIIGLSALAVVWLGQQVWSLRTGRGLNVTDVGIAGVRGTATVTLAWSEVARAEAVWDRGAKLVIHRNAAPPVVIEPRWTGSDPNLVAAIVTHYLEHPEDRRLLAEPLVAVQRV